MTKKNQILMDRLAEAARQGKISRREFMHHSIAAGVTTTAATGLWTTSAKVPPDFGCAMAFCVQRPVAVVAVKPAAMEWCMKFRREILPCRAASARRSSSIWFLFFMVTP